MSKTSIISKFLTAEEKKKLRRNKVKLADLFYMEEAEILSLLECDESRLREIALLVQPVGESIAVSLLNSKDYDSRIYGETWGTSMEHLGAGLSAAVNKSIGNYGGISAASILAHQKSASVINSLSGFSAVSSGLKLTLDNATRINDLIHNSAVIGHVASLAAPMVNVPKLSMTIPKSISSALLGYAEYSAIKKQESISSIYQSLTGLGTILSAAAQATGPVSIMNSHGLKDSISASIWGQNNGSYITANPSQGAVGLSNLVAGVNLAINGAVKGSWLESSAYQSLGISSISNNLPAHFKSSEIFAPGVGSAMSSVALLGNLAEKSLSAVKWSDLGKITGMSHAVTSIAENGFTQFASDYSSLLHSIDKRPNWIYEAPNIVELSSNAFYTQSRLVELVSLVDLNSFETTDTDLAIDEQNTVSLHQLLHRLNPDMVKMWDGAIHALKGSNPDFLRHFTLSIRELYTHLTHALSPDKEFMQWDVNGEHLDRGRPTRQGRLYYINRNLHGSKKEFSKYLNIEVKNTLDLMDMLNGGTHGINSSLTRPQLVTIKIKAEQLFVSLLQIEFSINRAN